MNSTIELSELKARAITKEGKAIYFDKENLKEIKDEESGAYRIFAIEGIEIGSEIEYYYTRKMRGGIYDRVYMQQSAQVKNSSFQLACPGHLKFDFKSYFGYPPVKVIEEAKEGDGNPRNMYSVSMKDIPAIQEEEFSNPAANRMRIEFKLAYNTARSQARLYTWEEAAKTFYGILYEISKDDVKALEKFVKTLGDRPSEKLDNRIRNIEQKIKTSIQVDEEGGGDNLGSVASILKYKVASKDGITRLYAVVFEKLNIACQPVITCSREKIKFDGDFDSWSYLDEYLLYFPDTQGFISPFSFETRYPLVPAEFTAQKGLFLEPLKIGEVKSALAAINEIPAIDYKLNTDNLAIDAYFNDDLSSNTIQQVREFGGYNATFFMPYYDLMTEEQRVKMVEELTKQFAPDATIKKWSAKGLPDKGVGNFMFDINYESTHFLEKAGPRILFKVGELIGPQTELYRDDKRVSEIENDFNRGYERVIRVHIPKGYVVKNPNDLKLDISYTDNDKKPFLFKSTYELKGDVLEIKIDEYYKEIYAPVARYEEFRKVINAAADFNKITLILEKAK